MVAVAKSRWAQAIQAQIEGERGEGVHQLTSMLLEAAGELAHPFPLPLL